MNKFSDAYLQLIFEVVIGIDEGPAENRRGQFADKGLSGATHSDEYDGCRLLMGDSTTVRSNMITSQFDTLNFETDLMVDVLVRIMKGRPLGHTLFSKSSHQLGQVFSTHLFSSRTVSLTAVPSTLKAMATRWSS